MHGEFRVTRDIDVTLGLGPWEVERVLRVVVEEGWEILHESIHEFVNQTMVLPVQENASGTRIDFIFSFSPFEQQMIEHALVVPVDEVPVRYVTAADLLILKLFAGRPRDLEDAKTVLLKNRDIDLSYVRGWLALFGEGSEVNFMERLKNVEAETGS